MGIEPHSRRYANSKRTLGFLAYRCQRQATRLTSHVPCSTLECPRLPHALVTMRSSAVEGSFSEASGSKFDLTSQQPSPPRPANDGECSSSTNHSKQRNRGLKKCQTKSSVKRSATPTRFPMSTRFNRETFECSSVMIAPPSTHPDCRSVSSRFYMSRCSQRLQAWSRGSGSPA